MLGDLAVGTERAGHDDGDVVLAHDVARSIAHARLKPGVGDRREAPQRPEVVRGLLRVAHPELDVVDAVEGQEVLGLGVGVLVDVRAGLVGGAAGDRLGHRTWLLCCGEWRPEDHLRGLERRVARMVGPGPLRTR